MISFTLNGQNVTTDADPQMPLLRWLRAEGLTGTKEGCAEGECGACAVNVVRDRDGSTIYETVNSCLLPIGAVTGQEVMSVEGIGSVDELHPVQQAMVNTGGSQCGYCTPGFVVSLFGEYYRPGRECFDPESIAGNLCRCTGYRPIRDAGESLGSPAGDDRHLVRLRTKAPQLESATIKHEACTFHRPASLDELQNILKQAGDVTFLSGGTDLMVVANQFHRRFDCVVALEGIQELHAFEDNGDHWRIGASVPLSTIERRLGDTVFGELFELFSSRLIRNRATLGGNLANASPIGDSPPVLLAMDAELELFGEGGTRTVTLDGFFLDYRKTQLHPREIIAAVRVPKRDGVRFFKVSKRVMDDISIVAAGLWVQTGDDGTVTGARLAYGGVAATPIRAKAQEKALIGQPWTLETATRIATDLTSAFTPMDDHRGSAAYRASMTGQLLMKYFEQSQSSTSK